MKKIRKLVYWNLSGAERAGKKRKADQSVIKQVGALNRYFGDPSSATIGQSKKMTDELDVPPIFKPKRTVRKKRLFDCDSLDQVRMNNDDSFRTQYFLRHCL
jgi:hypothetical protein